MAGPASDYHRGDMDIQEQAATFKAVMAATKWGSLSIAVGLVLFILWFCTGAGFVAAVVSAVILAVVGVFFLRDKPSAH